MKKVIKLNESDLMRIVKRVLSEQSQPEEYYIGRATAILSKGPKPTEPDDEYINNFLNELGVDGDGVYYIKVKDSYMTPTTKLINVDAERTVYLLDRMNLISIKICPRRVQVLIIQVWVVR
jgi:hypothetical protein